MYLFICLMFLALVLLAMSSVLMRAAFHISLHEPKKDNTYRESTSFFNIASALTFWAGVLLSVLSAARFFAVVMPGT